MKVYIKEENNKPIQFMIPNALFMNHFIASIGVHVLNKKSDIQLTTQQIYQLFKALKESKKIFGNYCLVEVEANDGTLVRIDL